MSVKDRAIKAIEILPENTSMIDIVRELSFITGIEEAREEIARGEGMNADQAKEALRECLSE